MLKPADKVLFLKVNQNVSNALKFTAFFTNRTDPHCPAHFDLNTDYLVIADVNKATNHLYLSLCSNIRKWDALTTDQKEIINTYKAYPNNFSVRKQKK